SSSGQNGNLGGAPGADGRRQNLANLAKLPGTYKAWLSDATSSPATRFTKATVPYTLVDGTVIAQNWTDLISGTLRHAIDLTKQGTGIPGIDQAWTATEANGSIGRPILATRGWTNYDSISSCNASSRLYSFPQQ
ncbi:MAG: hypothetical protein QM692_25060, partial [Thermomicrobiales bacterium]